MHASYYNDYKYIYDNTKSLKWDWKFIYIKIIYKVMTHSALLSSLVGTLFISSCPFLFYLRSPKYSWPNTKTQYETHKGATNHNWELLN